MKVTAWGCDRDTKRDEGQRNAVEKRTSLVHLPSWRRYTKQLLGAWDCATGLVAKGLPALLGGVEVDHPGRPHSLQAAERRRHLLWDLKEGRKLHLSRDGGWPSREEGRAGANALRLLDLGYSRLRAE